MDTSYVAVAVVTSRTEAELIAGLLRSNGLEAAVSADDAGGQDPQLQILGRRAGGVHVAEQVQRQQPARPGPVVDPPVPVHLEAALDVPSGIAGIGLAGKPHRNRPAHPPPAPPPALADELVERLPQDRLAASGGERLARRAGDAHHRLPPGDGSSRRAPCSPSADQISSWHSRSTSAGTAPRTATNPSAANESISAWLSTQSGCHGAGCDRQRINGLAPTMGQCESTVSTTWC